MNFKRAFGSKVRFGGMKVKTETQQMHCEKRLYLFPRVKTAAVLLLLLSPMATFGQGIWIATAGPVNRSMGGASTAAPINATGALYWNPATISGLPNSELDVGLDLLLPDVDMASFVPGFGGDTTKAEPGAAPLPSMSWVHHLEDSPSTFGVGMFPIAGFRTNYPGSTTNPLLTPQPPNGIGLGRVFTEAEFFQIAPVLSYAVTDRLSVSVGPTVTMGRATGDAFVFSAPDDSNMDGIPTFTSGRGTRWHWGGGAQAGFYYIGDEGWHFGASIKSPQWMERIRAHSETELGTPRVVSVKADLPMVISAGAAYSGIEDCIFAVDVRYFQYASADLFGDKAGFRPDGSLSGLDWSSILAFAVGAQRRMNDQLYLRAGYTYNQNPIQDSETFFNFATPLIQQHIIHTGFSRDLNDCVSVNMAYSYVVASRNTGPIITPGGAIPGSSVSTEISAHFLSSGVTVRY